MAQESDNQKESNIKPVLAHGRARRNPIIAAIALPILASIWIVGWFLYWIGAR